MIQPPHWFLISLFVYLIKAPPFSVKLGLNHHIGSYYLPVPLTESTKKTPIKPKCAWSNWFTPTHVRTKAPSRKTPGWEYSLKSATSTSTSSKVWWLHLSTRKRSPTCSNHSLCIIFLGKKRKKESQNAQPRSNIYKLQWNSAAPCRKHWFLKPALLEVIPTGEFSHARTRFVQNKNVNIR